MNEGWFGDEYVVVFSNDESRLATEEYGLARFLPGYELAGLRGWDDLVVRNVLGETYTVPAVPISEQYLSRFHLPEDEFAEDARFKGKVKWYVKPIALGGDPSLSENITWVTHAQHRELVVWWNVMYRDIKAGQGITSS